MHEIKIETVRINARSRRLGRRITVQKGGRKHNWFKPLMWTCEPIQPMECHHALDVEEELERQLTAQILGNM